MNRKEIEIVIKKLQKKMNTAAADLNFELAAQLRDQMIEVKKQLQEMEQRNKTMQMIQYNVSKYFVVTALEVRYLQILGKVSLTR